MICTMLYCVRSAPLDIWRVIRCVCFWPSCLSGFTSLSTDYSGHVLFSTNMLQSAGFMPLVVLFVFCVINMLSFLSPLLNGILQYQYIITALKLLFVILSSAFVYKHNTVPDVSGTKQNLI